MDREPDRSRAMIAHLFIEVGFYYLTEMAGRERPLSSIHERVMSEAIELSRLLAESESFKS